MAIKQIHQSIIHTHTMNPVPRTRPNLSRLPRCCLLSCLCVLLAQCSSTDTGFERLEATAATNPSRDAIVGMWHRNEDSTLMTSYLFSGDGTGVYRGVFKDPDPIFNLSDESQLDFKWTYTGGGYWQIVYTKYPSTPISARTSGSHLLFRASNMGMSRNQILTRVD